MLQAAVLMKRWMPVGSLGSNVLPPGTGATSG